MAKAKRGHHDRGVVMVLAVFLILAMGALMALALNSGHGVSVKSELQNAVDAAALAGAKDLNGTLVGANAARASALQWAQDHFSDNVNKQVEITAADIVLGHWDTAAKTFTPLGNTLPELLITNAVCVQASRGVKTAATACQGAQLTSTTAVPAWFGGGAFLTKNTYDVSVHGIAIGGGTCDNKCPLPVVFASCNMLNPDNSVKCPQTMLLTFNSNTTDTLGFTNLAPTNTVTPTGVINALNGTCTNVTVGSPVGVNNGAFLAPVADAFAKHCGEQKIAPVAQLSGGTCAQFNTSNTLATVVGFATVVVADVYAPPGKSLCWPQLDPDCAAKITATFGNKKPNNKIVCMKILCDSPTPQSNGCVFYGTQAKDQILVQ